MRSVSIALSGSAGRNSARANCFAQVMDHIKDGDAIGLDVALGSVDRTIIASTNTLAAVKALASDWGADLLDATQSKDCLLARACRQGVMEARQGMKAR